MTGIELTEKSIAARTAAGLKLTFLIPADDIQPYDREWTCYPHNHETREKWIASKAKLGWTVVENHTQETAE